MGIDEHMWAVVARGYGGVEVLELVDGAYIEVAHVTGDEAFRATAPFAVDVVPGRLLD